MANNPYGDFNFQLSPDMLAEAERLKALEQSQQIPQLQLPEMAQGVQGTGQPSREEMLAQVREKLMQRMADYDPEQMESEKAAALAGAETSGGQKAASIIGSMLMAGAGTPKFANLGEIEAGKKKAILSQYAGKEAAHQKDLSAFQKFEDMDAKGQKQERESAQHVANMKVGDLDLKLKKLAYGDSQAARDPSSEQSQFSRKTVRDVFEIDVPETASALQLKTYMDKAPDMMQKKAAALLKQEQKLIAPTEGEKVIDREFAKDYNEWNTRGKGTYGKNMDRLKKVRAQLEKHKDDAYGTSGRFTGRLPDVMRSEESIQLREDVHASAQGALRATLGAQFTEKEGERIMKASYNDTLSPAENIAKIDGAIKELETNAATMNSRSDFFKDNRTLKGWKAAPVKEVLPEDIFKTKMIDGVPVKFKKVEGGWQRV